MEPSWCRLKYASELGIHVNATLNTLRLVRLNQEFVIAGNCREDKYKRPTNVYWRDFHCHSGFGANEIFGGSYPNWGLWDCRWSLLLLHWDILVFKIIQFTARPAGTWSTNHSDVGWFCQECSSGTRYDMSKHRQFTTKRCPPRNIRRWVTPSTWQCHSTGRYLPSCRTSELRTLYLQWT